jgi:hypothetical protein
MDHKREPDKHAALEEEARPREVKNISDWGALAKKLAEATGPDPMLDEAVAASFAVPDAGYTSLPDKCRWLAAAAFPNWRLHLGFSVSGIFPYARLSNDAYRFEAEAPTVPLAILRVVVEAARA